jgi:uncharacterized damage-inducible protein DinB
MDRPERNEYAAYFIPFIDLVKEENLIAALEDTQTSSQQFLATIPEDKGNYCYAEGKWSVKQVIGHIIDTERVFAYRALTFAREKETADLKGYDHDHYVTVARSDERTIAEMAEEFQAVRAGSIQLFKSFDSDLMLKRGKGNNNEMSVRAIGYLMAGHEMHHLNVIKERYL